MARPECLCQREASRLIITCRAITCRATGAGGQVIVSTTHTDHGEVVLRVRDTGNGMTEKEIQMALEPFRQPATSSRWGSGGTGLGLPLTESAGGSQSREFFHQKRAEYRHAGGDCLPARPRAGGLGPRHSRNPTNTSLIND
jgi:hypothetical protein